MGTRLNRELGHQQLEGQIGIHLTSLNRFIKLQQSMINHIDGFACKTGGTFQSQFSGVIAIFNDLGMSLMVP